MKILLFTTIIFLTSCEVNKQLKEYNAACEVFNEAIRNSETVTASYVLKSLKDKVGLRSEVFNAWSGLVFMPPDPVKKTRYTAFRSIAKKQLNMEWDCLSMQSLADSFPPPNS